MKHSRLWVCLPLPHALLALLLMNVLLPFLYTAVPVDAADSENDVFVPLVQQVPDVRVVSTTDFYSIDGTTIGQLRAQLNKAGTQGGMQGFIGRTDTSYHWQYHSTSGSNSCQINVVTVTMTILTVLPTWHAPPSSPQWLRNQWAVFSTALRTHEHGHYDIGVATANKLWHALRELPVASSCEALDQQASVTASRVTADEIQQQQQYDLVTSHGATQGALF